MSIEPWYYSAPVEKMRIPREPTPLDYASTQTRHGFLYPSSWAFFYGYSSRWYGGIPTLIGKTTSRRMCRAWEDIGRGDRDHGCKECAREQCRDDRSSLIIRKTEWSGHFYAVNQTLVQTLANMFCAYVYMPITALKERNRRRSGCKGNGRWKTRTAPGKHATSTFPDCRARRPATTHSGSTPHLLSCTMLGPLAQRNARVMRDIKARQGVAANEVIRRAYLYVARNQTLPPQVRHQAQLQLNTFDKYTRPSTIKNRCAETGRGRGVMSEFALCRVSSPMS
jgi:small subunit ribosomal protein S14